MLQMHNIERKHSKQPESRRVGVGRVVSVGDGNIVNHKFYITTKKLKIVASGAGGVALRSANDRVTCKYNSICISVASHKSHQNHSQCDLKPQMMGRIVNPHEFYIANKEENITVAYFDCSREIA